MEESGNRDRTECIREEKMQEKIREIDDFHYKTIYSM